MCLIIMYVPFFNSTIMQLYHMLVPYQHISHHRTDTATLPNYSMAKGTAKQSQLSIYH